MKPEQQQPIPENEQAAEQVESDLVNQEAIAEMSPEQQQQLDAYTDNATMVVYSEGPQKEILHSLQSGKDPIDSVAKTAYTVHKQLENSLSAQGEKMTEITLALGAAHLVSELITLADAAGLYDIPPEDRLEVYRQSLMYYFQVGIKDGSIDPVELQQTLEPLMNQEQAQAGMQAAGQNGLSKTPPPSQMTRPAKQQQAPQQRQGGGILGGR